MDPEDPRSAGLAYAIRVLAQSYAEHPGYRQEWRPQGLSSGSGREVGCGTSDRRP
ncbi:DUF6221 family protein [Streptomyces misionensis]|uniref:DUF6221 family protein n=1 Tax=Streptomyces misionensis TaxID=67331 RepID=UPI001C95E3BE|nr:DUF6221 family protein [Streptomyces misionensis]